ncbi:VOC family protein [Lunatibacter salilacus]|uniref:VOC family protein n=1 Tax=Lunatibacter salilacus TaxID=2483804 RepID=UPI00131C312C|nr:VOC family protein [Lunatibacter salilacus]
MEQNMIGWFEIPVIDMNRAKKFYEIVFDIEIQVQDFHGTEMGWFPFSESKPGAAGSLIKNKAYSPSEEKGVLIYFSSTDISTQLKKVLEEGGKILQAKTLISEDVGFMGLFVDSEGNRIALHSRH